PDNDGNQNTYATEIAKTYDFKFGPNPFSPGNATTTTGTFIPGEMFVAAKRCGTCHTDAHAQWRQSAHGNAFREPFYQKNVKDLQSQRGIEFTRHCEACHNPAALFTGALTKHAKVKRPFDDDGVSCIACHSIQSVDGHGIGGYVMGEPALLVKEDGTRLLAGVSDQQILDDIPSHRRAMMRPLLKTPEFCGACHKSQVPHELNDYKFLRAFIVADDAGKALYRSGFIKPDGYLDESAHNYKTYLVKSDGTYNDKHHIWRTRVFAQNNQINSGRSDVARYEFHVPANLTGALHLTARARYRRFTRVFSDYVLGKSVDYPIVTMATTEYTMQIGDNS